MLATRLKALRKTLSELTGRAQARDLTRYRYDPTGYMRDVLHLRPWSVQEQIARLLLVPPYRVLVRASYSVGKTWLLGALCSWWYDTRNPSCVLTTAPTHRDVAKLLWREIRLQRKRAGLDGFRGETATELFDTEDHYAAGFTADKVESYRGRHQRDMLFGVDEATGVETFWDAFDSMWKPDGFHAAVAIYNPTNVSSQVFMEEKSGTWHLVKMRAIDHPNVLAQLQGQPEPYPAAVSLPQVNTWIRKGCTRVPAEDAVPAKDLEWPPGSGIWHRPGPRAEAGVLARWPSQAIDSVWSEGTLELMLATRHRLNPAWRIQLGCDVADQGDDDTDIHVRQGMCSLHHESHNGWPLPKTAHRLKELAHRFQTPRQPEKTIPILYDSGGFGAQLRHSAGDYHFVPVNSSEASLDSRFRNVRSELWFNAADAAAEGLIDVSRLDPEALAELTRQLLAAKYSVNLAGQLEVEPKAKTKLLLKRSPDGVDAFNLAYLVQQSGRETVAGNIT